MLANGKCVAFFSIRITSDRWRSNHQGSSPAHGSMDRFPTRLQDNVSMVYGIGLVHLQTVVRERLCLSGFQSNVFRTDEDHRRVTTIILGDALFDGLLYSTLEFRSGSKLQGHRRSSCLGVLSIGSRSNSETRRLDNDTMDSTVQSRPVRQREIDLRENSRSVNLERRTVWRNGWNFV